MMKLPFSTVLTIIIFLIKEFLNFALSTSLMTACCLLPHVIFCIDFLDNDWSKMFLLTRMLGFLGILILLSLYL